MSCGKCGSGVLRYLRCPHCEATNERSDRFCNRCGLDIELNFQKSWHRSLALLVSAIIFYIPANLYPILQTSKFSSLEGSTIIEGVIELWSSGDYPVALVIFIASVMIPLIKFLILIYLLITIRLRRCKSLKQELLLYHLIEITGPWSLIDVFVVVILVALIHFQSIAIIPGFGATSFALMVFFTMMASNALDERILGEICER